MVVQTKAEPDGLPRAPALESCARSQPRPWLGVLQRCRPARAVCTMLPLGFSCYHGIRGDWVGRDFKNHPVASHAMGRDTFQYPRSLQALSSLTSHTSRDGAATAPAGNCPSVPPPSNFPWEKRQRGQPTLPEQVGGAQEGLGSAVSGAGLGAFPDALPGAAPAGSHGGPASPAAAGLQLPACRGGAGRGAAGSAPGEHRERGGASAGPAEPSRAGAGGSGAPASQERQDERGNGAQRGEPQHPGDEQPRHLAVLRAGHRAAARRAPQHPLLQRPRGLDPHQHHPQPEHVHLPAHREGNPLRDPGPGQGPAAHALGADGLWSPVHCVPQVPHHHAHRPVFSNQLLHQVRPGTLHHQHHLPHERPDPQTASVPRSEDLWHQQVLSGVAGADGGGAGPRGEFLSPAPFPPPTQTGMWFGCLKADPNRHIPHAGSSCPINPNQLQSRV